MSRTVKAIIEKDGTVTLREEFVLRGRRRALVTILDEDAQDRAESTSHELPSVSELVILSEEALARDWDRPEEDEAWASLSQEPPF